MCRNYDAGECVEDGCTGRITCQDFADQRCLEHTEYLWVEGALEDWVTDETLSREETLARFEALNPVATDDEVLAIAREGAQRWRGVLEILAKR